MIVYGKDTQFCQGNFGSKVAEISVRILGTAEFLNSIVLPVNAIYDRVLRYIFLTKIGMYFHLFIFIIVVIIVYYK